MTVTINGTTGIAGVDGSAATPAVQGGDTNTGMFFPAADTIAFTEGGTEVMRINSFGYVGLGTTTPACALDVIGGIETSITDVTSPAATDGNIFSGTYTPTLTNTTNISSSTAFTNQYMRVGNTVIVSGQVTIDATTGATNTVLGMTLPIASAFTSSRQAAGSGCSYSTTQYGDNNIAIIADATNDRVEFRLFPDGNSQIYTFSFTYRVI